MSEPGDTSRRMTPVSVSVTTRERLRRMQDQRDRELDRRDTSVNEIIRILLDFYDHSMGLGGQS